VYDTRCYFNVRSKADISQLNLPHGSLIYRTCGRNALFCVRRYQCALSDIVFNVSNISVDAVVDRYVSSGISGAQRRESEFLRELTSIRDRVLCLLSVFCQSGRVILRHLSSMFVFLSFSVFIFLLR